MQGAATPASQAQQPDVTAPKKEEEEEDEVEDIFDASLFLNQDYVQKSFEFGDLSVPLLVSQSACTDFDLTGQILWPAAELLASYLAENSRWFRSRRAALELGAGLGLVGCLAARYCPLILTDHNQDILNVLRRNADLNCGHHALSCALLDWTSAADIQTLRAASPGGQGFDLLLGADVAYGQQALPALFSCAAALMQRTGNAAFLLGYVSRAKIIDRSLPVESARAGLSIQELPGTRLSVGGGLEGVVFHLRWLDLPPE